MITEQSTDLTALDSADLHERIGVAREEMNARALQVCWTLQSGENAAERLVQFIAAEAALDRLYAENGRRVAERKAAGTWPFAD